MARRRRRSPSSEQFDGDAVGLFALISVLWLGTDWLRGITPLENPRTLLVPGIFACLWLAGLTKKHYPIAATVAACGVLLLSVLALAPYFME